MDIEAAIVDAVRSGRVRVPPYPKAALKLAGVLGRENFTQHEVVDVVKTDAMLVAAVLRVANSPNYQRGQPVSDITSAVQRVGTRQLQALAMASGVQGAIQGPGPLASLRRRAWLEALCSARVCEVIAHEQGDAAEKAFVAGLLHDLGKVLAIACIEDILKLHPEADARSEAGWWRLVEELHLELGLVLSARWQLPDDLVQVITEHHEPEPTDPMVRRVALSDEVVRLLDSQLRVTADALGTVGQLTTRQCEVVAASLSELPDFIASFELDPTPEGPSKVTYPTPTPTLLPHGHPVMLHGVGAKSLPGHVVVFGDDELTLSVTEPVRANVLGTVELPDGQTLCVRVRGCVNDRTGQCLATVSPFALSTKQEAQWRSFAQSLMKPAA